MKPINPEVGNNPAATRVPVSPVAEGPRAASHHHRQFEVMGAHPTERGTWFTVWAPNARAVGVIGAFNRWHCEPLERVADGSGRWAGFVEGARPGHCY
jgi:1,4-alpha-glucan branching enzyme